MTHFAIVTRRQVSRAIHLDATMAAILTLAVWVWAPAAYGQGCADVPPDWSLRDCNGNAVPDEDDIASGTSQDVNSNGIPDECDFRVCYNLWDGFESFGLGTLLDGVDYDGDGIAWDDPKYTALIDTYGCPNKAVFVEVWWDDPEEGYVASEYFRTLGGELDCGLAAEYSLAFRYRILATISKYDWVFQIKDAASDKLVIQIEFISEKSERPGMTAYQGYVVVKDPGGGYVNTGVLLADNTCFDMQVVLDNVTRKLQLYIDGVLELDALDPLDEDARRMDYFRVYTLFNDSDDLDFTALNLDTFQYCITGPALMDWPDCNGNCVDDWVDLANGVDEDCNSNGVPDACDAEQNCSCAGPAVLDNCIACNHDHQWDFEPAEGFSVGDLHCQENWRIGPTTEAAVAQIVASGPPFEGQPDFGGQALMLGTPAEPYGDPQGIREPRTRDEQPDNPVATTDPDIEFWEVNAVLDANDTYGDVFFIVWDECADSFVHPDPDSYPDCFTDEVPSCFLIEESPDVGHFETHLNTYAYFNAGVRFHTDATGHDELRLLSDGNWYDVGDHRSWSPGESKHLTIRINNATGNVAYYAGPHTPGQLTPLRIWEGALETAFQGGDRHVLLMSTSGDITSYWDSFRYATDRDCDRDCDPDSLYLAGGVFYEPEFDLDQNDVLDWCEDCNANCLLDSEEIELGLVTDCDSNGIPDECDLDPLLPLEWQYGCTPPGGKNPCTDYGCDWPFYTRQGGGGADCNSNAVLDECDIAAGTSQDCNGNNTPDECDPIGAGDFDGDGDVDLNDYRNFADCLAGPGVPPEPPSPECIYACRAAFDFDTDEDVDLGDFAMFQTVYNGTSAANPGGFAATPQAFDVLLRWRIDSCLYLENLLNGARTKVGGFLGASPSLRR